MLVGTDIEELHAKAVEIFAALGSPESEARLVAEHIRENCLIGFDSHGYRLVPDYVRMIEDDHITPGSRLGVVRDGGTTALLTGNWGFGQQIGTELVSMARERAAEHGVFVASVRECNHLARLGAYTGALAAAGFVSYLCVNGHGGAQGVAPWGGREKRLSVNPFSYGIPTEREPIVLDISPSVVAAGKVIANGMAGKPLPDGWIIDHKGNPSTNPADLTGEPGGSLLPLGGHKGFGLGLIVDILAGALSGDNCSRPDPDRWGNAALLVVLSVESFATIELFHDRVNRLVEYVKSSAPTPWAGGEILVPGEPEMHERKRRLRDGIPVPDSLIRTIDELRERLV